MKSVAVAAGADALAIHADNGDADACVPYNGNEDWTSAMASSLGAPYLVSAHW